MCFTKSSNKKPLLYTAKKDIACYKVLKDINTPKHYSLQIRKKNGVVQSEPYKKGYIYTEETTIELKKDLYLEQWEGNIGFHSYRKKPEYRNDVTEFRIPKGTKYYKNVMCYFSQSIQRIS